MSPAITVITYALLCQMIDLAIGIGTSILQSCDFAHVLAFEDGLIIYVTHTSILYISLTILLQLYRYYLDGRLRETVFTIIHLFWFGLTFTLCVWVSMVINTEVLGVSCVGGPAVIFFPIGLAIRITCEAILMGVTYLTINRLTNGTLDSVFRPDSAPEIP